MNFVRYRTNATSVATSLLLGLLVLVGIAHPTQVQAQTFTLDLTDPAVGAVHNTTNPFSLSAGGVTATFSNPQDLTGPNPATWYNQVGAFQGLVYEGQVHATPPDRFQLTFDQSVMLESFVLGPLNGGAALDIPGVSTGNSTSGPFASGPILVTAGTAIQFQGSGGGHADLTALIFSLLAPRHAIASIDNVTIQNHDRLQRMTLAQIRGVALGSNLSTSGQSFATSSRVASAPQKTNDSEIQLVSFESVAQPVYASIRSVPQPVSTTNWTGWFQGFGLGGSIDGTTDAAGLEYGTGGAMFGVHRWVKPNAIIGVTGSYGNTNINDSFGGGSQFDSYRIGTYAMARMDAFYMIALADYIRNDYETTRQLNGGLNGTADGEFAGNEFGMNLEVGRTSDLGAIRVTPLVGLQYIHLHQSGFEESGAGALNLAVASRSDDSLRTSLGARVERPMDILGGSVMPFARALWIAELLDDSRIAESRFASGGGSFTSVGNSLGRNFFEWGAGLDVLLLDGVSMVGTYEGRTNSNTTVHGGTGSISFNW